jgi:P27 family predicted phage terminase small subunit
MPATAMTPFEEHLTGRESKAKLASTSVLPGGRPRFPKGLRAVPAVKQEWLRVCKLLESRGTITTGDSTALFVYARAYQRWLEAEADIDARGVRYPVPVFDRNGNEVGRKEIRNPSVADAANLRKEINIHLTALGLTPASRDRVKLTANAVPESNEPPAPGTVGYELMRMRNEVSEDQ